MLSALSKPSFIIFDYGETLGHEDDFRPDLGFKALLDCAVSNPALAKSEDLLDTFSECFRSLRLRAHAAGAEIPNLTRWKWLFEMYDLEFDLPECMLEDIFWNAAAPCIPTPGMRKLLALLRRKHIGTGVVSNMGFSGAALRRRLDGLYPNHTFDFVITSADYVLRKPDKHLFALALKKAGRPADEVWFAGDNPEADIAGAAAAGMKAVFYDRDLGCAYRETKKPDPMPLCIRIEDWSELFGLFRD